MAAAEPVLLPDWPEGTVCLLATEGEGPHAIPVSTALRAGDALVLLALGGRRGSLERLRARPRVALAVLAQGDVAFTAHGAARVAADPLPGVDGVVAVAIEVDAVRAHTRPAFTVEAGVAWSWTDDDAARRDEAVRAALRTLAGAG